MSKILSEHKRKLFDKINIVPKNKSVTSIKNYQNDYFKKQSGVIELLPDCQ
jgi:hypothetical protein